MPPFQLARKVHAAVLAVHPGAAFAPERIGRAPKTLLLFCTAAPFTKRATGKWRLSDGTTAEVEILASGQQFVAFHIHPETGRPYEWPGDSPLDIPVSDLPDMTEDEADATLAAVCEVFRREGLTPPAREPSEHGTGGGGIGEIMHDPKTGLVIDGRESHLTQLVWREFLELSNMYADDDALATKIAQRAWTEFGETTDLTRPKANDHTWNFLDAFYKAQSTVRNHPRVATLLSMPPTWPKVDDSLEDAYGTVVTALHHFFSAAVNPFHKAIAMRAAGVTFRVNGVPSGILIPVPLAPLHGLAVTTGAGKTSAALEVAIDDLIANPGYVGVFLTQTHGLADDVAKKAATLAGNRIRVQVYRGIERPDPAQPGKTMCHRVEPAKAWTTRQGAS